MLTEEQKRGYERLKNLNRPFKPSEAAEFLCLERLILQDAALRIKTLFEQEVTDENRENHKENS